MTLCGRQHVLCLLRCFLLKCIVHALCLPMFSVLFRVALALDGEVMALDCPEWQVAWPWKDF